MVNIRQILEECGFEGIGAFDPSALVTRQEVRAMCTANACNRYDTSWCCPPAIGSLEYYQELFPTYKQGYVYQTIATMEDEFDYESISSARDQHHERFTVLLEKVRDSLDDIMLFAAGPCRLCDTCTYPDQPCVHQKEMSPSLEACGLVVSEVCYLAQVPYYHGTATIAFIGGLLCSRKG